MKKNYIVPSIEFVKIGLGEPVADKTWEVAGSTSNGVGFGDAKEGNGNFEDFDVEEDEEVIGGSNKPWWRR